MSSAQKMPRMPDVVGTEFVNAWVNVKETDYHKDLSAVARGDILSFLKSGQSFLARRLIEEENEEKDDTDALRFGRAAHMLALEPAKFKSLYKIMPDFGDMRSPKNRASKEAWMMDLPPGSEVVDEEELTALMGICESLLKHPRARPLFEEGILEQCGYYRDPVTGLKGRIKPDCVSVELNGLFDFKTTKDIRAKQFSTGVWDKRYDIQLVKYAAGTHQILGRKPDILGWVAVEKKRPYEVAVYLATHQMLELGERDYRRAMDGIKESLDKNVWGSYQKDMENLDFPFWVYAQEGMLT